MRHTCSLLILLLLVLPIIAVATPKPRVGVILPLSGEAASYGEQFHRGLLLNHSSDTFNIIFEDSGFEPHTAIRAFKKLTSINQISYLISFGGATCQVLNDNSQRAQILHIAAGCNTADFTNTDSVNFRLDVHERSAAAYAARYLRKTNRADVALLYVNDSWGSTVAEHTQRAFREHRLTIVEDLPFDPESAGDIKSLMLKIRASKAKMIFLVSLPNLTPLILRQIKAAGLASLPIMSTISVENPEVIRLSGADAEGVFYVSVASDPRSRDKHPEFFAEFPAGNPFAAWGYDSLSLIHHSRTSSPPWRALQKLQDFVGAFNAYSFESTGELHLPYEIREIHNGSYRTLYAEKGR